MNILDWMIAILFVVLVTCLGMLFYYSSTEAPTKLTKKEVISMCNARGGIYADGVCQRVYLNLCRRL